MEAALEAYESIHPKDIAGPWDSFHKGFNAGLEWSKKMKFNYEQVDAVKKLGFNLTEDFNTEKVLEAIEVVLNDGIAYQVAAAGPNSEYFGYLHHLKVLASVKNDLS